MKDLKVDLEELREEWDSGALAATQIGIQRGRKRGPLLAFAGLAAVSLLLIAGWLWFGQPAPAPPDPQLAAVPLTSYPGNERTPALSPDGSHVAFSWNGKAGDNYDIYVQVAGVGEPLRLSDDPAFDWAPAWSHDGREIRFYRYRPEGRFAVVSVPPLPGRERILMEYPFPPGLPEAFLSFLSAAWSPDGSVTAQPGQTGIVLHQPDGSVDTLTDLPGGAELFPAFSPDGRKLAFVWQEDGGSGDLCVLRLDDGFKPQGDVKRLVSGMLFMNRPVWMPDSEEVVFSAVSGAGVGLWRIKASGGAVARPLPLVGGSASWPSLSADGTRLAFEKRSERSSLWRVPIGGDAAPKQNTDSMRSRLRTPTYSPDGSKIAFASDRGGASEIWMAGANGSEPVQLTTLEQFSRASGVVSRRQANCVSEFRRIWKRSLHRERGGGRAAPPFYWRTRRIAAELVSRRKVDLLCFGPHGGARNLADPRGRGRGIAGDREWR